MKKKIQFEYERSVRWGAEQATLHDALYSMGLVAGDSRLSTLYRSVYGSAGARSLSGSAQIMSTPAYSGKALLLLDSPFVAPQSPSQLLAVVGSSGSPTIDLSGLSAFSGKTVFTADQVAQICNDLRAAGQLSPTFDPPDNAPFEAAMFTPKSDGSYGSYKNASGGVSSVFWLLAVALGTVPSIISPEDVAALRTASDFAAQLGISLADIALAKPNAGISDTVSFSLRADWTATDLTANSDVSKDEGGDWLRFNAERPGGKNFDSNSSDDRQQGAIDALNPQTARGITSESAAGIHRQAFELAKRQNPGLAQSLQYDVRKPDADIQKKDTYAVLRIASGFSEQWSDIYANPGKFKTLFQTNRFLLQGHQESRAEAMNLVKTFGPTYLYLFGEQPNVWNYSGVLMDTVGLDWLNEWRSAWKSISAGTRTARAKARAFLIYRDVVREGILLASAESASINEFGYAMFSFTMFVIREHFLSGDPQPGQTSPQIQTTPQAGAQASAKENFDYSFRDATEDARTTFLASLDKGALDNGQNANAHRVFAIENELSRGRTQDIEDEITGQAFSGGQLVAYAGSVKLKLDTAQAQEAISVTLRLEEEANMRPTAAVVGG